MRLRLSLVFAFGLLSGVAAATASAQCDPCSLLEIEQAAFPAPHPPPAVESLRETSNVPASAPSMWSAGLWLGVDSLSTLGASRGALDLGRLSFGARVRSRHFGFGFGAHVGGGYVGRADGATMSSAYFDMGISLDLRTYLLDGPVQPFVVGGAGLVLGGIQEHDPLISEECLSDIRAEVSGGGGLEVALSDRLSLTGALRVVYRHRLFGDVPYYVRNGGDSQGLWGLRGEVRVVFNFDAASSER